MWHFTCDNLNPTITLVLDLGLLTDQTSNVRATGVPIVLFFRIWLLVL
jgi:hypothetical protein